jgi:hypothetical protein
VTDDRFMRFDSDDYPKVQALFRKHHFGQNDGLERYITLQVSGARGRRWTASLFGSEHEQINEPCQSMEDGCLLIEQRFRTLFPDHACNDSCFRTWQPMGGMQGSNAGRIQ